MLCRQGLALTVLLLIPVCALMATTTRNPSVELQKRNSMPLPFVQNQGQWDERELFGAKQIARQQDPGKGS